MVRKVRISVGDGYQNIKLLKEFNEYYKDFHAISTVISIGIMGNTQTSLIRQLNYKITL